MKTFKVPVNWNLAKRELTDDQIERMIAAIQRWMNRSFMLDKTPKAEEYFGLAYTSGTDAAGLWNTNVEHEFLSKKFLRGFVMDNQNYVIAITQTVDEEEHWFAIAKLRR